jgi:hypothetical protein
LSNTLRVTVTPPFRIDLQVRRSVWAILAAALSLYRRYPFLFLLLALAVVAPYDLALFSITGYGPLARLAGHNTDAYWLNLLLRATLVGPLVSALHIHAVKAAGEGRRPRLRPVASRGLAVFPIVSATALLTGLAEALGFLALVVPGVLLFTRWAVSSQAAAIDGEGPLAAIRSSTRLTGGRRWHVFGLLLVVIVIVIAVDEIARALPLGSTSAAPSVAIGIAVQTFGASLGALTLALLYFELNVVPGRRRRKPRPFGA